MMTRKLPGLVAGCMVAFWTLSAHAVVVVTTNNAGTIDLLTQQDLQPDYAVQNNGANGLKQVDLTINLASPINILTASIQETGNPQQGFDITSVFASIPHAVLVQQQGGHQVYTITFGNVASGFLLSVAGMDNQASGNDFNIKWTGTVVPLPAAAPLFLSALAGLWGVRRWRKPELDAAAA
jgi:hypothetical protein